MELYLFFPFVLLLLKLSYLPFSISLFLLFIYISSIDLYDSWSSHLFFELGALRIVSSLEVSALDFASWGRRSETLQGLWLESFPGPPSMLSPGLPRKIKGSKRMRLVSTFHMSWPLHDEPLKFTAPGQKVFASPLHYLFLPSQKHYSLSPVLALDPSLSSRPFRTRFFVEFFFFFSASTFFSFW